jgi:hypothetical protein
MRRPTRGSGPRGTIRIIETPALFDRVVPLATDRGRPTSSAQGQQLAQQNDKTKPMLIWEEFADHMALEGWRWLSQNLRNKPSGNLDKVCGSDWLAVGYRASEKTMQTKPTLPKWRPGKSRGLLNNEQTKPTLLEWRPITRFISVGDGSESRSHRRPQERANEANQVQPLIPTPGELTSRPVHWSRYCLSENPVVAIRWGGGLITRDISCVLACGHRGEAGRRRCGSKWWSDGRGEPTLVGSRHEHDPEPRAEQVGGRSGSVPAGTGPMFLRVASDDQSVGDGEQDRPRRVHGAVESGRIIPRVWTSSALRGAAPNGSEIGRAAGEQPAMVGTSGSLPGSVRLARQRSSSG